MDEPFSLPELRNMFLSSGKEKGFLFVVLNKNAKKALTSAPVKTIIESFY